ncbi:MAG: circadian clock protein KaiC [Gammaproteobacteria bacterium]
MPTLKAKKNSPDTLKKSPTGIQGLDEITFGGLPTGRPTFVYGSAGCGKTLLSMEFLVRGAMQYKEPGLFMAFEETADELTNNVASLGFDLADLERRKKILIDHVHIERSEIEETGEYDLEGLFIRLEYAIDSIGAKRVVLDTLEALFGGLSNATILRAELRRLFRWLKAKGVTVIITGERSPNGTTSRHGLEEYVSDCVILLDHRVNDQTSTRRLRVVKYRGTRHGTNEYPFLIDEKGISVLPVTSMSLEHKAMTERVSSGIPSLDAMLGGKGFFRGTSILISGTAGTGKTSFSAKFVESACRRGERALFFSFEESESQIIRNMRSIGVDLQPWVTKGLLKVHVARPMAHGLEMHLLTMHNFISEFKPAVVVVDPISTFTSVGSPLDAQIMVTRLIDFLKFNGITAILNDLSSPDGNLEKTDVGISSLADTWIMLETIQSSGERNRGLHILKSRGMEHSNQIREYIFTAQGIDMVDVYVGSGGVLTGSARLAQEAKEEAEALMQRQETEHHQLDLERRRRVMEAQIAVLRDTFEAGRAESDKLIEQGKILEGRVNDNRTMMARSRKAKPELAIGTGNRKRKGAR